MNNEFDASFMSRLFYFTMHLIIWTCLIKYNKNPFMENIFQPLQIFFICIVIYSNYLFMKVNENPGYVKIENQNEDDIELQETKQNSKRFCQVCNIIIPNRGKHCKYCKKCIAKYDHHCFWMGGCIGELNHRKFWFFLLIQTIVIIMLEGYFYGGLENYPYYENDKKRYGQEYGAFIVLYCIMFLFLLFSGGMLIFHTYLIIVGVTTYELFKKRGQSKSYNRGIFKNIKEACCHKNQLQEWE